MSKQDVLVSVIIPLHNAVSYISDYVHELGEILENHFKNYEIILIDDGCTDETVSTIYTLQTELKNLLLFRLSRHFGVDIALTAGLDNCIGDFVITLNPITDPVTLIPEMVSLGQQGHEVVYGVMHSDMINSQQRGKFAHFLYQKFYQYFDKLTDSAIPENFSSYRMCTRHVLNYVLQHEDRHRLLKVIPALAGFKHTQVTYMPLMRAGYSQTTPLLPALFKGIDIIFSTSIKPLRIVTFTAIGMAVLNMLYTVYILLIALFKQDVAEGWITLSLQSTGMFFLLSVILAILSEYIFRMMESTHKRPLYQITEERFSGVLTHRQRLNVVSSEKE